MNFWKLATNLWHTTMYKRFNRRVEYVYNNSLFKTTVGEVYCIRYNNQPVIFADVTDVGKVTLLHINSSIEQKFDATTMTVPEVQQLARDMLDDILYLEGTA